MQSVHTLLKLAQLRRTGYVTRMPGERLPKRILYGELEMDKHSHGGQKKRYKDTHKASLKDFNIPTESWEQIAQDEQSCEASSEEVLVNMRQKESAKSCSDLYCSICINEVINGIFILFLVIFGTYQIICELFLLRSTIESLVVCCSA